MSVSPVVHAVSRPAGAPDGTLTTKQSSSPAVSTPAAEPTRGRTVSWPRTQLWSSPPPPPPTVTLNLCSAVRPSGSRAVTVTIAVPSATAASVSVLPDRDTETTAVAEDSAVYVSAPPSGSRKNEDTSKVAVCPAATV